MGETLSQSHESIARERTAELRRWAMLVTDLKDREEQLRSSMSQRRSEVLKDKKLALFERLISESNHQDVNLIEDLTRGFDLTGELPKSGVFDRHLRPAKVSCDNLRTYAKVSRDSVLKTVGSSGEDELGRGLWEATLKEVSKGFLESPVEPESMPPDSLLTKRCPVRQKNKIRPIDDYKANMVNQSVTQTEGVTIHTIDHIASMVAYWLRGSSALSGRSELVAKCWDFSDACKQIPLSDEACQRDAFLAVYCPDSRKVFRQKVLPFGSLASVTAFLRVSLALWAVGNSRLKLAWSAYLDDFSSLCEKASAKHTDVCISAMFSFLGWKLSEDKLIPFDSVCKVLGVRLDLNNAKFGIVKVANTPERVEELVEELSHIVQENRLSRKDGEKLRGRLQLARSQLFGRSLRKYLTELNNHGSSGRKMLSEGTKSALCKLMEAVTKIHPREVARGLSDHVHIYVDASFEPGGYSGIGGLCVNSDGSLHSFFSEAVPKDLLCLVEKGDKETIILELEMVALLVAATLWRDVLRSKRTVFFTDNEPVRKSLIRGYSQNHFVSCLMEAFYLIEEEVHCQVWRERVPSQSNPADEPSRAECSSIMDCAARVRIDVMEVWVKAAQFAGGHSAAKD
eukprot:Skav227888  [mRNA]  locus=scaffold3865:39733:41610:- [translate_table: standard]